MLVIKPTTWPIFSALPANLSTSVLVRSASATAWRATVDDCPTWRLISVIDADNSSVAVAALATSALARSAAA